MPRREIFEQLTTMDVVASYMGGNEAMGSSPNSDIECGGVEAYLPGVDPSGGAGPWPLPYHALPDNDCAPLAPPNDDTEAGRDNDCGLTSRLFDMENGGFMAHGDADCAKGMDGGPFANDAKDSDCGTGDAINGGAQSDADCGSKSRRGPALRGMEPVTFDSDCGLKNDEGWGVVHSDNDCGKHSAFTSKVSIRLPDNDCGLVESSFYIFFVETHTDNDCGDRWLTPYVGVSAYYEDMDRSRPTYRDFNVSQDQANSPNTDNRSKGAD